jgi:hypothetical protein
MAYPSVVTRDPLTVASVDLSQCYQAQEKATRTGTGSTALTVSRDDSQKGRTYRRGPLIDTITLHYCAPPGLILVGVLSKSDTNNKRGSSTGCGVDDGVVPPHKAVRLTFGNREVEAFEILDNPDDRSDEAKEKSTSDFSSGAQCRKESGAATSHQEDASLSMSKVWLRAARCKALDQRPTPLQAPGGSKTAQTCHALSYPICGENENGRRKWQRRHAAPGASSHA